MDITITTQQWQLLQQAPQNVITYFEQVFANELKNGFTAEQMQNYSANQITLLAYLIFRQEMMEGGLVQLIYNGYAPFIFLNPFAKAMRLWGLRDFSKFIYAMRELYEENHDDIEGKELSDEDFMALYELHPEFEEADDDFIEYEPKISVNIANFVLQNPQELGIVVK